LLLTVDKTNLAVEMFQTVNGRKTSFDKATINLATRRVT
jgi:hypothetical protein